MTASDRQAHWQQVNTSKGEEAVSWFEAVPQISLDFVHVTASIVAMNDPGAADNNSVIDESLITCPHCGTQKRERMLTDACQFFYVCGGCGERLKPKPGDCCVFCSYGSVPCPPIQAQRTGGAACGC